METLIELYDERPLENVLSAEVFKPKRTVYLCPAEIAQDKKHKDKLKKYFEHRGVDCELIFLESSMYNTDKLLRQLRNAADTYPGCALDITGGTDAALFAGGLLSAERRDIPVFTYSRKKNRFYNISGADFADSVPCPVKYNVEDCFLMAGGAVRQGRVDNSVLSAYLKLIDPFFALFLKFKRSWTDIVTYMQRVSQDSAELSVNGQYTVKGERGSRISCNEKALHAMQNIGLIRDLKIVGDETVSFVFRDAQVRKWLRDVGSVLEVYIYKACLDTGLFQDVCTSVIVDWEGDLKQGNVTNEIDVMAACDVVPVFISCKTCDVKTEALNELAILRDRFGSGVARAAIVTAENGSAIMRQRASELDIDVIDIGDLRSGAYLDRIRALGRNHE